MLLRRRHASFCSSGRSLGLYSGRPALQPSPAASVGLVRETGRVLCRLDVPGAAGPEADGEVVATISAAVCVFGVGVCVPASPLRVRRMRLLEPH